MKSFRVTKTKEQIEEQRKLEEHSLNELAEFFTMLAEAQSNNTEPSEEQIIESAEIIESIIVPDEVEEPLIIEQKSLVDVTAEQISQTVKEGAFELPDAPKSNPELKILQQKVQDITNWLSKITMTGAGSGEVWFRWLNDVNRGTMSESNDNWLLEYDATTKKVQFTENIGPIRTIQMNVNGPSASLVPGQIGWNSHEDCLDIRQHDGTTLQAGLEQYYRVFNSSETTLTHGTLVGFGGIVNYGGDELPVAVPYTAGETALPLYIMGVLTTDIPPNGVGRATVFGKVRTLNTTGDSGLGETWNQGDLLWAHPTMAGRLTKVQPTAPYPAISVAAVLRVGETDGVLLVRPTIFPRLWFGRFRDFTNQTATVTNTPYAVLFNQTAASSGMRTHPTIKSRIIADHTGMYEFIIRLQFTSSNSSVSKIWVWYRVNGVDADGTGTQYTISANGGIVVATLPYIVSLQAGHYIEVMWAVDSTSVSLLSPATTSFSPATPCAVVAVTQVNL